MGGGWLGVVGERRQVGVLIGFVRLLGRLVRCLKSFVLVCGEGGKEVGGWAYLGRS